MNNSDLEFWGVRGTVPVSHGKKIKYGGNTICSYLETSTEDKIIIDAGTGIMELGKKMMAEKSSNPQRIHLLLTHFHLDHIMGLPFFPPLYSPDYEITFYSAVSKLDAEEHLSRLMAGKFFPLNLEETPSKKRFKMIPKENFILSGIQISIHPLNHPQGSIAYRFDCEGRRFVLAMDTEHPEEGVDKRLAGFCRDADILVYDAMYTPEEYHEKKGWGHSTWRAGTELAQEAGVSQLYLIHFNPDHVDSVIDGFLDKARERFPQTYAAREEILNLEE